MKRLETTRRKQKTSADGSELKTVVMELSCILSEDKRLKREEI